MRSITSTLLSLNTSQTAHIDAQTCSVCAGHSRPGALQDHHHGVLPRGHGLHPNVRHHQRGVLRRCAGLVSRLNPSFFFAGRGGRHLSCHLFVWVVPNQYEQQINGGKRASYLSPSVLYTQYMTVFSLSYWTALVCSFVICEDLEGTCQGHGSPPLMSHGSVCRQTSNSELSPNVTYDDALVAIIEL